jgi:hypothetical protein
MGLEWTLLTAEIFAKEIPIHVNSSSPSTIIGVGGDISSLKFYKVVDEH